MKGSTLPNLTQWPDSYHYFQGRLNICVLKRSPRLFCRKGIGGGWGWTQGVVRSLSQLSRWDGHSGSEVEVGQWEGNRFPRCLGDRVDWSGCCCGDSSDDKDDDVNWVMLFTESLFVPGSKLFITVLFFFFFNFIYLFYLWLCWVFVSVRGLSLVVASGGRSSSRCAGLSCCGAQAPDA